MLEVNMDPKIKRYDPSSWKCQGSRNSNPCDEWKKKKFKKNK